jgi:NTE family protein
MLLMAELARHSLAIDPPDLALTLPVGHVEIHDFTKAAELIDIGWCAVKAALPEIEALVVAGAAQKSGNC